MPETVWAIHNFEAEAEDEISFNIGEPIIVLQKDELYQDGWWEVRQNWHRRHAHSRGTLMEPLCNLALINREWAGHGVNTAVQVQLSAYVITLQHTTLEEIHDIFSAGMWEVQGGLDSASSYILS